MSQDESGLQLSLKATTAQLEAHKGMVQDLYNMNISLRTNHHLVQTAYNEVVHARNDLGKELESLKVQLAQLQTECQASKTEVERLKALLPAEQEVAA